ncbi:hypothetical protein LTR53_004506 [Teratosphaeriaceae sp. CCFEE 6253]|nr:hypothetical protein LTR53_004506 [Teratosphaeriaceae sp. CCFEE 6253]
MSTTASLTTATTGSAGSSSAATGSSPVATTLTTSTVTSSASLLTTPLLSFFTAPSSCDPALINTWTSCSTSGTAVQCAPRLDNDCLPAPSASLSRQIFSPGVCPQSYYAAGFSGMPEGATTAWCCPSGCIYNSVACASIVTGAYSTSTGDSLLRATVSATTTSFIGIFPTIQVAWAVSDLPSFSPASAPILGAQAEATSSASPGPTETGALKNTSKKSGAAAGIGVGLGLAALFAILGLLTWYLIRRRRRTRAAASSNTRDSTSAELPGYELDSKRRHPYAELGEEGAVSELAGKHDYVHEADGGVPVFRHELEGDFTPAEVRGDAPPIGVVFPRLTDREKER